MDIPKYIPGDLVIYQGQIREVKGSILHYTKLLYNVKDNMVDAESLQGLPLSPQILEANGWIKNPFGEGGFIERYTQNGLTLFIYHTEDDEWICRIGDYDVKIKLVHQFQHLLFGLGLDSNLKV